MKSCLLLCYTIIIITDALMCEHYFNVTAVKVQLILPNLYTDGYEECPDISMMKTVTLKTEILI